MRLTPPPHVLQHHHQGGLDDKLYTGTVPYTPNVGSFFYGMQVGATTQ